jgi:hypothetical protein
MENEVNANEEARKDVEWKDHVSHQGKKFRVGYIKKELMPESQETVELSGNDFDIRVNWPAVFSTGPGIPWRNTDSSTENVTGIKSYALYNPFNPTYQWELDISVNYFHEIVQYIFHDQEGDYYGLLVWNSFIPHYIQYNSTAPTIIRIEGIIDHGGPG